ncbi:MAG: DUF6691 family protein [Alphaproteobacteria bacterium]
MTRILTSLLVGALFGGGLTVSGMIDPARVLGFLDVAGRWDPTLALVMIGALGVTLPAFAWARRAGAAPLRSATFDFPTRRDIDRRLIAGAAIFGVGWGLSGLCPGPGISALASGLVPIFAFAAAMIAGMALFHLWNRRGGG